MTNEAAERLRLLLDSLVAGQAAPKVRRDYAALVQREALAAERRAGAADALAQFAGDPGDPTMAQGMINFERRVRRATVARIRERLAKARRLNFSEAVYFMDEEVDAILDEVAAR